MSDEAQQSPGTPRGSAPYIHRPPQRVEVEYPSFADFVVSMGPLLSKLRLFVETDEEVPLGTTVHTEIRLHGRAVLIRAMGEVSGHEEADGDGPAGIHVELRYLDPASAALIDAVLRHGREAIATESVDAVVAVGASADEVALDDARPADETGTDVAEVPESGELNLAGWEDEVGNLVELALVDESAPASSTEVHPPSDVDPSDDDPSEERAASVLSIPEEDLLVDPETSEDLENEAADALAVIAAQVMTGSDEPPDGAVIELDDTRPVPETNDVLEDTQPVVEVSDDDTPTDVVGTGQPARATPSLTTEPEPSESIARGDTHGGDEPSAAARDAKAFVADPPRQDAKVEARDDQVVTSVEPVGDLGTAEDDDRLGLEADTAAPVETTGDLTTAASEPTTAEEDASRATDVENENESKTVSQSGLAFETSDIVLADVFADGDEPSSMVKPPTDDDAFSLDEIPDSERDLWSPDGGFDELTFEEPSPSIEMYVSSFGPSVGGGATETSETMPTDDLEETAGEPALRRKGSSGSLAPESSSALPAEASAAPQTPAVKSPVTDLDARLPSAANVKPLTSVDEGETSFAFGDDTAALLGGLDAWPSDGSSEVTPPVDWPPTPPTASPPPTPEERSPVSTAEASASSTSMEWGASATSVRPDQPVKDESPAVDPLDEPPSEDTVAVRLGHAKSFLDAEDPPEAAIVEPAADPLVLENEMPATVAAEMARNRLNEMAGSGAVQARQRSWRPLLLLLLLVALAGLALAFDWPAARWARERLMPTSTVASAPTNPGAASAPTIALDAEPTPADSTSADSPSGSSVDAGNADVPSADVRPDTQAPADTVATVGPGSTAGSTSGPSPTTEPVSTTATEPEPAVPTTDAPTTGEPTTGDVEAATRATVRAWQQAWSDQDPDAYLATYAQSFVPSNGATRAAWAASRRVRVRAPGRIRIGVDDLRVRVVSQDRVEAWFFQTYETDETTRVTWKQLDLVPEAPGRWRIQRETVRPGPPS